MSGVDLPVLALVLLAAIAHAAWNGWLKKSSPDFAGLAAMSIGWLILGVIGLLFVGLPDGSHWPYLLITKGYPFSSTTHYILCFPLPAI